MPIAKVKPADIQEVIMDLAERNPNTGKPTAKQTLRIIRIAAIQVFQLAVDNRILDYSTSA